MAVTLRPETQQLLEQLIAAERRATERQSFTVYRWEGGNTVEVGIGHPGFPGGMLSSVFEGDIAVLAHEGLLIWFATNRQFGLTPQGYAYNEQCKHDGEPAPCEPHQGQAGVMTFGAGAQLGDMQVRDVAAGDIVHLNVFLGAAALPETTSHLSVEQEQLLCEMVEAARRVPVNQREKFTFAWLRGSGRVVASLLRHPGFPNETRSNVYEGDLEELARADLLDLSPSQAQSGQGSTEVAITNRGYAYYDAQRPSSEAL